MVDYERKTRNAVLWFNVLSEPLTSIYTLLPFILYQELGATPFQLAVFFMVKPVVSLFSLYWSHWVEGRKDLLNANVAWGGFLARIAFFALPFFSNTWFVIILASLYWMFFRGVKPAWLEILKLNLPEKKRSNIYSWGSILGYAIGIVLAIAIGPLMDAFPGIWKWMFPACALVGLIGVWLQYRIPINGDINKTIAPPNREISLGKSVVLPWRNLWSLLRRRPDFSRFQWGIVLCGFAIMVMKPAEPIIVGAIGLSYTNLAIAILILKGFGYILTSAVWAKWMGKINIFAFTSVVFIFVGLCYFLLFSALYLSSELALYLAYFTYGIWLAGNHLSWNLAGPIFSGDEDSSAFTTIGVALVGLRGIVGPSTGSLLLTFTSPYFVLSVGIVLCVCSSLQMLFWGAKYPKEIKTS
jgi:MFS family permease